MNSSLEAKHLIWVWIMKVKWPKNQADFIEVLYVVVNAWGASFWNTWEYGLVRNSSNTEVIPIGSEN